MFDPESYVDNTKRVYPRIISLRVSIEIWTDWITLQKVKTSQKNLKMKVQEHKVCAESIKNSQLPFRLDDNLKMLWNINTKVMFRNEQLFTL